MTKKRIFISFAMEDEKLRNFLIGQRNNKQSPFEFIDMSVKQPWDSSWKTNCRTRIKCCGGMIGIITNNTRNADGQLWEIRCAKEKGVPLLLIYGCTNKNFIIPPEIKGFAIYEWRWEEINNWINSL